MKDISFGITESYPKPVVKLAPEKIDSQLFIHFILMESFIGHIFLVTGENLFPKVIRCTIGQGWVI